MDSYENKGFREYLQIEIEKKKDEADSLSGVERLIAGSIGSKIEPADIKLLMKSYKANIEYNSLLKVYNENFDNEREVEQKMLERLLENMKSSIEMRILLQGKWDKDKR